MSGYITKDLPKTRDENGRYIPGSMLKYHNLAPVYDRTKRVDNDDVCLIDGKFQKTKQGGTSGRDIVEKTTKNSDRTTDKQSFCFTLSSPIMGDNEICLPSEFTYRSIHVEDVCIYTNSMIFGDVLCCSKDSALNEIWFTEGLIIQCNDIRLSEGGRSIVKSKTFTKIDTFELVSPWSNGEVGFKQIRVNVPCHNLSGNLSCMEVFLLETSKHSPNDIQYWPFLIDSVQNDCITLTPKRNGKHIMLIPPEFRPEDMLILPPLGPEQIAEFINESVCNLNVRYECNKKEYEIYDDRKKLTTKRILPGESEYFLARITPRKYKNAEKLVPEIQRSMNPPLITSMNNTITVNGTTVSVTIGEYSNAHDLAREVQTQINKDMGWDNIQNCISVGYDDNTGRFIFRRVGPFRLEFKENSLKDVLGFSDYPFIGNVEYISNYQVYYVTREKGLYCTTPNNRYLAFYDHVNDLISIRAVSRTDYLDFLLPQSEYHGCPYPGHNFVLPFAFLCDSPFTSLLEFQEKGCFLEWISTIGVSDILGPPPILYMIVPGIEGDIMVSKETCNRCNFTTAMAQLCLESNKKMYKSKSLPINELTKKKNIFNDRLYKFKVQFFTERGIEYCFDDSRGVINFRVCVG